MTLNKKNVHIQMEFGFLINLNPGCMDVPEYFAQICCRTLPSSVKLKRWFPEAVSV